MFTGLVAAIGAVERIESDPAGARISIASELAGELAEGDSIAVSGVCLTATGLRAGAFDADVMNQTLELTSLGELSAGARVNLEPALRATDRLGGHIVQGHVDAVGRVSELIDDGFARRVRVELPGDLQRYVVERGSIALDGVSLTVAALDGRHDRGVADPGDARANDARGRRGRSPHQRRGRRDRPTCRATPARLWCKRWKVMR